jgi:D-amino-acid dehydrogenase
MGVATAYFLARDGHSVHVVEKSGAAAEGASKANGGVIHASGSEPFAQPGMPMELLRKLGREDAPYLLRPEAIPHMWAWGLRFLRNCRQDLAKQHAKANLRLANASFEALAQIRAEVGLEYGFRKTGALKVFHDLQQLRDSARSFDELRAYGLPFDELNREDCLEMEPALNGATGLVGGLFFPNEEIGDPNLFVKGLASYCTQMGVTFSYGVEVLGLTMSAGKVAEVKTTAGVMTADTYVVAVGAHSGVLLRPAGVKVWVYPLKGVTVTVPSQGWEAAPTRPIIDGTRFFGLVPLGDKLRCSGSAEFPEFRRCYDPSTAEYWAGLRPATPTGTPYVGRTPVPNLFLNTGHTQMGWTQGCGSGRVVADIIAGRDPAVDMEGLAVA